MISINFSYACMAGERQLKKKIPLREFLNNEDLTRHIVMFIKIEHASNHA